MIRELLLKTFIPVSRIFDDEDDIFIFHRNVRKSSASENYLKKQNQKYYEILTPTFGVDTFSELGSFQLLNNDDKNCIQNSTVN